MAKLGARGRTELVRLEKKIAVEDPSALASERRYSVALMSDEKVLTKMDVVFRADGKKHSYGWKDSGKKIKAGLTVAEFSSVYESQGYVRV